MSDFAVLVVNTFSAYIGVIPFLILLQVITWKYKLPKRHQFGLYIYSLAICTILMASDTPSLYQIDFYPSFNFIPFYGFEDNLEHYIQSFLIFIPFGLLLPTLWKQFQPAKEALLSGIIFSLLIELSQLYCLATTATTDITDVIMNILGTLTGYFIFLQAKDMRFMGRMCLDTNDTLRKNLSRWEVYIYLFTSWLVTFLLAPFISNAIWDFLWDTVIGMPI
ncbi:MAG: VanZ family protein [Clostridiales bacterium]|nr:VanZ family protein [Clostridiales bacterium]